MFDEILTVVWSNYVLIVIAPEHCSLLTQQVNNANFFRMQNNKKINI